MHPIHLLHTFAGRRFSSTATGERRCRTLARSRSVREETMLPAFAKERDPRLDFPD
jgi:hypothetical protein